VEEEALTGKVPLLRISQIVQVSPRITCQQARGRWSLCRLGGCADCTAATASEQRGSSTYGRAASDGTQQCIHYLRAPVPCMPLHRCGTCMLFLPAQGDQGTVMDNLRLVLVHLLPAEAPGISHLYQVVRL